MGKLPEVEEAKALMTEAIDWSVIKWLREKKRVRKTADRANALLDRLLEESHAHWDKELLAAYCDSGAAARKFRQADQAAHNARMDAEAIFDDAEKQLSTALAREGCRKTIHSWDLYEKAIRLSQEAAGARSSR
ncbi:MAG TPA: hypothetical protein VE825_13695 [Terriglobales bacterium]|nr:hypothetical protein [Terriglobales bacterium]